MSILRLAVMATLLFATVASIPPALAVEPQSTTSNVTMAMPDDREPMLALGTLKSDYSCLSMGEMVSMIAGAVVGGAAADFVLRSAPFTVVGIAAGAAIGSMLYRYSL